MAVARTIPDEVRNRQTEASDPHVSAWVAANAGSGKTHVLAQRVIRLLLEGVEPGRILCITFTKAAAANMANRVFDTLRKWTLLDDAALDEAMREIGVERVDAARRARARRLFALALETPGGLKVQTIHAFCTHLLHLFPFEAGVAARFTVLDEAQETQLLDQLILNVLLEAAAQPEGPLGRALSNAIVAAADVTFRDLINEAIRRRDHVSAWIDSAGSAEAAAAQLSRALGVDPADTRDRVEADFFDESFVAAPEWPAVAAALNEGTAADKDQSQRFRSLATLADSERLDGYLEIFCTAELKPRKNIITKGLQAKEPALFERLMAEQERVCRLVARRRAIAARDRTAALVTIAHAVIARYRTEKDRRGLLDYDDLIDKTLTLLSSGAAGWVHYKLDRGIDHLLIDEAQDTSPKQWEIIKALVGEFTAGLGARGETSRTIFAVGDEKQSIFSFQGAAPQKFAEMRRHFQAAHENAELRFAYKEFKHSFRSGPNVLGAVDIVFSRVEAYAGLTADRVATVHESLPQAEPGLVEIWPLIRPDEKREIEGWDAPFDEVTETSPPVRLARRIAANVKLWRQQGRRAGDVLVLVRRRGALFEAIIRALKNAGIPVAGADRLVLTEHIAIMDLMALADALLLPEDDLALATVLKSPLFGFDDAVLFELAWNRKGPLRATLRAKAGSDLMLAAAAARLDRLAEAAQRDTPFAFYARLLGAEHGRKQILARLGHEAADALDEFLNLALDYERNETPSLQGFVAWLRAAKSEVKRDMEIARDEVRVMTVHGAKGLEAPVVILAETTTPPQGWHPPRLLALPAQGAPPGTPDRLIWAGPAVADVGPMKEAREAARGAAQDEYRRLLYVAMTRAIDRLIVCGVEGERKKPEGCWYDLVVDALKPGAVEEPADDGDGAVLRYRKTPDLLVVSSADQQPAVQQTAMPGWLTSNVRADAAQPSPLSPSRAAADFVAPSAAAGAERQAALARGVMVHRLMQSLPDVPLERRPEAIRRYLARRKQLGEAERDAVAKQVAAVLADARFAPLFAPGSRAEVPIVGRVGQRAVSGVVDRLVVTGDAVLIADYKTNRPAPRKLDDVPPAYLAQLALYRAVLGMLYPDRPVRAVLLWTDLPELMEIPAKTLDSTLVSLTSA
jgi:ATP-dependent helicase/nuclease subunit A